MNRMESCSSRTLVLETDLTPLDKATSDYKLLSFPVPPGIGRLTVHYEYTNPLTADCVGQAGNIIDIGLFDPRGSNFLGRAGFRGWSGSARREFTISPAGATPGYLPGPLPPGEWQVLLGLYQIAPQGCHCRVTVEMVPGSEAACVSPPPYRPGVLRREARWYRGDLQCHTCHSDARGSLTDLVAVAKAQLLDFLAVTEHNTTSHLAHLAEFVAPDFLPLPGQEITTYYGHANAWGIEAWQEFRCRDSKTMQRIVEAVHAEGALFSVNHPKEGGPAWEYSEVTGFDAVEVWQGPWFLNNYQSLAFWESLLRQGQRVTAVGGSDVHQLPPTEGPGPYEVGTPTTWVYAEELSINGLLTGIKKGRVFVSESPDGPRIFLTAEGNGTRAMMGDSLTVCAGAQVHLNASVKDGAGFVLRLLADDQPLVQVPISEHDFCYRLTLPLATATYVRAEVMDPTDEDLEAAPGTQRLRALSNPIYLRPAW